MIPGTVGIVLRQKPWWRHLGELIVSWGSRSPAVHAFVVVSKDGLIIEAQPQGACTGHASDYPTAVYSTWVLTTEQQQAIVAAAYSLVGTPYNWLDDLALGLTRRFGWHLPQFVLRRVASPDHLQCAQLVDLAYAKAGIILFADGRPGGDVTPGDLLGLIKANPLALP